MRILAVMTLVLAVPALAGAGGEAGRYIEPRDYVRNAFPGGAPGPRTLWVAGPLRDSVEHVLGHRFADLRVRYWFDGATSVWILDEIGKELPITIGVTVADDAITDVSVLEFRESRGWEVRYPFFTDQFKDARLTGDDHLDRNIDSITGATLSVGAVTRVAKVALLLHDKLKNPG